MPRSIPVALARRNFPVSSNHPNPKMFQIQNPNAECKPTAGLGIIPQKSGHNGCSISHFLASDHPWHGISSAEGGFHSLPNDRTGDFSSTVVAEDGRSLQSHPSQLMKSARNSIYSGSSTPALTSDCTSSRSVSDLSSTQYKSQMYNLSQDSFGNPTTHRPNTARSVAIQAGTPKEGTYHCIFAFDGCSELRTLDAWKSHVNGHLSDANPPDSCTCTICGEEFDSGIPEVTWSRFLSHVLSHKYSGTFKPDPRLVEFFRDKGIISDFTCQRHSNFTTQPASPEPYQRHERERDRRARTPRRVVNTPIESRDIAQVEYPSSWGGDPAMQQAIERDIVVNRGNSRAHRGHRA